MQNHQHVSYRVAYFCNDLHVCDWHHFVQMVYMLFWIDTLQMFTYDDDNIECSDQFLRRQTKRAV